MKRSSSKIWVHFKKKGDCSAECRHCFKSVKSSGNTTNLILHIKRNHPSLLEKQKTPNSVPSTSKMCTKNPVDPPPLKRKNNPEEERFIISSQASGSTSTEHSQASVPDADLTVPVPIADAFLKVRAMKSGGDAAAKITQSIIYMICKDCEPFRIVERKGFRRILKTLAPQYSIPDRTTLKRYVEEKYKALSHLIKLKLEGKTVTLTTDIWTDLQVRSYLSLTVHYFDESSNKMVSNDLAAVHLEENHTGELISKELLELCHQWNINKDDVLVVVSDNASSSVTSIT
ncbi:hypothetical protein GE061_016605 [Apolygus lucorum]|uniref:BED-type domain-containing protein n=1 Tax=Apolygus lucorum TaxID=248454 RepID=A0A8S9XHY7_APOLU|nr:hypothetical protein GE061_016605 [Apolygus lucorum]